MATRRVVLILCLCSLLIGAHAFMHVSGEPANLSSKFYEAPLDVTRYLQTNNESLLRASDPATVGISVGAGVGSGVVLVVVITGILYTVFQQDSVVDANEIWTDEGMYLTNVESQRVAKISSLTLAEETSAEGGWDSISLVDSDEEWENCSEESESEDEEESDQDDDAVLPHCSTAPLLMVHLGTPLRTVSMRKALSFGG